MRFVIQSSQGRYFAHDDGSTVRVGAWTDDLEKAMVFTFTTIEDDHVCFEPHVTTEFEGSDKVIRIAIKAELD